ncbi:uncharacterized protein LOC144034262 isoform X2 [Vanacampus margaritifer]
MLHLKNEISSITRQRDFATFRLPKVKKLCCVFKTGISLITKLQVFSALAEDPGPLSSHTHIIHRCDAPATRSKPKGFSRRRSGSVSNPDVAASFSDVGFFFSLFLRMKQNKIPSQTVSSSPCFCSRHLFRDLDFSKEEKLRATCASLHQTLKNSDARERCVFSRERQSGPKTPNARFASPHTKSERRQNNPEESFLMFPGKINTSEIQFTECAQEIKPASIGCRVREAGRDHGCVFRLAFRHVLLHRGGSEGSWYRTAGWGGSGTCQVAASSGESSYIAKEFDAPTAKRK